MKSVSLYQQPFIHASLISHKRVFQEWHIQKHCSAWKVWFESLDRKVESLVNCERLPCMSAVRDISTRLEPLEMSQMQPGSLQNLSFISVNHIPTGDHLMVLIDKYSIYPVLGRCKSSTWNICSTSSWQSVVCVWISKSHQVWQWKSI